MGNSLSILTAKKYALRWNCISFVSLLEVGWYTVSIDAELMDHKIVNCTPSTIQVRMKWMDALRVLNKDSLVCSLIRAGRANWVA